MADPTTEELQDLIQQCALERDQLDNRGAPTTREEGKTAYQRSCQLNQIIASARVALRERRARKGDSRAAALERCAQELAARTARRGGGR